MQCPRCSKVNNGDAHKCAECGSSLSIAALEVVRGNVAEKVHFLRPRSHNLGRARHNDLCIAEPSISKSHARIFFEQGHFFIEDQGSLHGVYINTQKVQRAELTPGCQIQLGNVTLKFSHLSAESTTDQMAEFPWAEQQELLLQIIQTLNSTLVLNQVMEQVLTAVMKITRAERGFLLLTDSLGDAPATPTVAGLKLRVARRKDGCDIPSAAAGLSTSVVRRAIETGETVATGNAVADPTLGQAQSVIMLDLRTIVCIPLLSPRAEGAAGGGQALGALYVDNPESSSPFTGDSLEAAEALARHAALAIENAQMFEREQRTIEELRLAQKQLLQSEKLASIGQMAAGIAHELNTPLTYIMGNLELLEIQELSDSQRDMLEAIHRGAERIMNLAQSLLAFSRPSREEPIPLAPNDVIARALELCHYQIIKSGIRLEKDLGHDLPLVSGVSNQLEMALINLVVNAVQAMSQGGVLKIASTARGKEVEITVSDTGPGIPDAIQGSIFEPFVTTKPEGKGTGLGLSTVLLVVERHLGRINFTTQSGQGTTFRITLPAVD